MLVHFRLERGFNDGFGQLLEHAVLADQVGRFLVVRDYMIQQGLRDRGLGFFGFVSVGHGGSLG